MQIKKEFVDGIPCFLWRKNWTAKFENQDYPDDKHHKISMKTL